jgi:hypothetical protein
VPAVSRPGAGVSRPGARDIAAPYPVFLTVGAGRD